MTIWYQPFSVHDLNKRSHNTMAAHFDIQFIEIFDDYLTASMPVDHRTIQPLGLLNGGASCALAETAGSTAANCCVDLEKYYCVGLGINASHVRAARQGRVLAVVRPFHLGKRTHVWDIQIHDEAQHLICVSRLTMAVIERKSAGDSL